jgi:hypothetical protein
MSRIFAIGLLCLWVSCGGRSLHLGKDAAVAAEHPQSPDAPRDTGAEVALDGRLEADARVDVDSEDTALDVADDTRVDEAMDAQAVDAAADSAADGRACPASPVPPPDVPSRQTVRFRFAGSSSGYLVSAGTNCLPFSITRIADGSRIPLDAYQPIICEGPAPLPPGPAAAIALTGTESPVLTWDARMVERHTACVDCSARWPSWPATGSVTYDLDFYVRVPIAPDRYRATFGVLDPLPSFCTAVGDRASCTRSPGPGYPYSPEFQPCQSSRTLAVDFDLPESGDVDVTVNDGP